MADTNPGDKIPGWLIQIAIVDLVLTVAGVALWYFTGQVLWLIALVLVAGLIVWLMLRGRPKPHE